MSRNQPGIHKEETRNYQTLVKKALLEDVQLHHTPVAVAVSITGERTLCPIIASNSLANINSNHPIVKERKASEIMDSSSKGLVHKLSSRKQCVDLQTRQKLQKKYRRMPIKIKSTQRNIAASKSRILQKCAAAQTNQSLTNIDHRTRENVGDSKNKCETCPDRNLMPEPQKDMKCALSELSGSRDIVVNTEKFLMFFPSGPPHIMSAQTQVTASGNPRRLITGPISNKLYRTPVAAAVSVTGERIICPAGAFSMPSGICNANLFANENKELRVFESTSEEFNVKLNSKKLRSHILKRRKPREKDWRRTARIILTQRNSTKTKQQVVEKCASVQTDPWITSLNILQECIGDPGNPTAEIFGVYMPKKTEKKLTASSSQYSPLSSRKKKLSKLENLLLKFLPESLKILVSYIIMIILIFWLTSVILDVDVPFDFFKMATNYVRHFKWNYYRNKPQTSVEKCLGYMTKLYQQIF